MNVINEIGKNCKIFENVNLGFPSRDKFNEDHLWGCHIGNNAVIRTGTVIYCDVIIGNNFQTGHNVIIRECCEIGDGVSIGTASILENYVIIGDKVNIQSNVYIPTNTIIGNDIFIGPCVVMANDKYPRSDFLRGPMILDGAVIGANSTLLPRITIGESAFVAAGSLVTKDVPKGMMAIGSPAKIQEIPSGFKKS
jgi:acetyltransferase-like isoleucine patch superfamily enzyme